MSKNEDKNIDLAALGMTLGAVGTMGMNSGRMIGEHKAKYGVQPEAAAQPA